MPLIPFVKNGFFGSRSWVPLVNGNGLTAGGGEPEPPAPVPTYITVTGVAPLALIGAIQHDIRLLKQFGKCTQSTTPTPDAPVDIMCNNGTIRMVDDELPSGYSRLTYIESDGTSGDSGSNGYVDTGIIINSIDTDVEIDFQLTDTYAPSPRMAWGYMGTPSSLPRWGFGAYSSKWLGSPNGTASTGEVDTDRHVAVMRVYNGGSNSAFYNGTLDGETLYNTASLGNVSLFEGNDRWSVYLFARNNNNTAANFVPCKIFRFKVYKTGALANDLVPCKDSNGVLGFYDLVTATFSVASGTLIAGAVDYSHAHIGADGTPEVLTVIGKNLYDGATMLNHGYAIRGGSPTETIPRGAMFAARQWSCSDYIRVAPETDYTITIPQSTAASGAGLAFYADRSVESAISGLSQNSELTRTVTTPQGCNYIRFSWQNTSDDGDNGVQLEIGNTATEVVPYTAQTVTDIPMLLSVGDTKDEGEIISGIKTGRVGIYVFTGEEAFTKGSAFYTTNTSFLPSEAGSITPICTHFKGISSSASRVADSLTMTVNGPSGSFTGCVYFYADRSLYATAADFKAWLASEYANGTPVIVVYPLATETTEQTTAHNLHTSNGDNVVDVTSNVDPVQFECEYANGYE